MKMDFKDKAQAFSFAVGTLLDLNHQYIAKRRYKHQQAALKEPIRQALKTSSAWAEQVRADLELNENPSPIERHTGHLLAAFNDWKEARTDYFHDRTSEMLEKLKQKEAALRSKCRAVNTIINAEQ